MLLFENVYRMAGILFRPQCGYFCQMKDIIRCRFTTWDGVLHTFLIISHLFTLMVDVQYIPRNMHTVFALLCFVVVIHWLVFPYPSGLLHWHCGNLTIAPVPAKQPWWIWINTSCEFIMNDCITTTKQSTTNPCAYFLRYTVWWIKRSLTRGVNRAHISTILIPLQVPFKFSCICFLHGY